MQLNKQAKLEIFRTNNPYPAARTPTPSFSFAHQIRYLSGWAYQSLFQGLRQLAPTAITAPNAPFFSLNGKPIASFQYVGTAKLPIISFAQDTSSYEQGMAMAYFLKSSFHAFYQRYIKQIPLMCKYYPNLPILKAGHTLSNAELKQWQRFTQGATPLEGLALIKARHRLLGTKLADPMDILRQSLLSGRFDLKTLGTLDFFKGFQRGLNDHTKTENARLGNSTHYPLFNLDDLLAYFLFADNFKGFEGCSVAMVHQPNAKHPINTTVARNLDWPSLMVAANYMLGIVKRTGHLDPKRPQTYFMLGFPPGIAVDGFNNNGLYVALSEAMQQDTFVHQLRQFTPKTAIPEFNLVELLLKNCSNINDIQKTLTQHPPASPCILTVLDANNISYMIECCPMPTDTDRQPAPFTIRQVRHPEKRGATVTTNGFYDPKNRMIPSTMAFNNAQDREQRLRNKIARGFQHGADLAGAATDVDTLATLIFRRTMDKSGNVTQDTRLFYNNLDKPYGKAYFQPQDGLVLNLQTIFSLSPTNPARIAPR